MNLKRQLLGCLVAVTLGAPMAGAAEPVDLMPELVTPEFARLLSCFACARVRVETEEACQERIAQDGESTWNEKWGCFLEGMLAEQDCLDGLQCL